LPESSVDGILGDLQNKLIVFVCACRISLRQA
jgi:hypothetical protein